MLRCCIKPVQRVLTFFTFLTMPWAYAQHTEIVSSQPMIHGEINGMKVVAQGDAVAFMASQKYTMNLDDELCTRNLHCSMQKNRTEAVLLSSEDIWIFNSPSKNIPDNDTDVDAEPLSPVSANKRHLITPIESTIEPTPTHISLESPQPTATLHTGNEIIDKTPGILLVSSPVLEWLAETVTTVSDSGKALDSTETLLPIIEPASTQQTEMLTSITEDDNELLKKLTLTSAMPKPTPIPTFVENRWLEENSVRLDTEFDSLLIKPSPNTQYRSTSGGTSSLSFTIKKIPTGTGDAMHSTPSPVEPSSTQEAHPETNEILSTPSPSTIPTITEVSRKRQASPEHPHYAKKALNSCFESISSQFATAYAYLQQDTSEPLHDHPPLLSHQDEGNNNLPVKNEPLTLGYLLKFLKEGEKTRFKEVANNHDLFQEPAKKMLEAIKQQDWNSSLFLPSAAYDHLFYLYANQHISENQFADIQINWLPVLTQFHPQADIKEGPLLGKFRAKSIRRVCVDEVEQYFHRQSYSQFFEQWEKDKKTIKQIPSEDALFTEIIFSPDSELAKPLDETNLRFYPITSHHCEEPCPSEVASWIITFNRLLSSFKLIKGSVTNNKDTVVVLPSYQIFNHLVDIESVNTPRDCIKPFLCYSAPELDAFTQLRREYRHPVSLYHPEVSENLFKPDKCQSGCFGASYHDLVHLVILTRLPVAKRIDALTLYDHIQALEYTLKSDSLEKKHIVAVLKKSLDQALSPIAMRKKSNMPLSIFVNLEENKDHNDYIENWLKSFKATDFSELVDMDFAVDKTRSLDKEIASIAFLNGCGECFHVEGFCHTICMLATLGCNNQYHNLEEYSCNECFIISNIRDLRSRGSRPTHECEEALERALFFKRQLSSCQSLICKFLGSRDLKCDYKINFATILKNAADSLSLQLPLSLNQH